MARPSRPIPQKTLKSTISCAGIGLHTGSRVRLTLHPADADAGVVFWRARRRGIAGTIAATWRNVVDTRLCSAIANESGTRIATVEHLMAALAGAEIDNCVVEIDGDEVPAMDGSAAPFMFLIECAGTIEQSAPRRAIRIREPVTVGNEHHRITIEPGNAQQVDFAIEFESAAIARQAHGITMESNVFRDEIARARTFGFAHEVAQLRANGLARGGSLENSVVVDGDRVLNEGGLRFKDEFVRHKILDCVGDLYLAGGPLLGRVRADRAGHRLNNLLLREVFARPAAWERVDLTEDMPAAVDQVRRRRPRLIAG